MNSKFFTGFLICLTLLPRPSYAKFDFEDLKRIIEDNHCQKIDDVIPFLPEQYRKHYPLLDESNSSQEASSEFPRVILYENTPTDYGRLGAKESYLYLAYNGSPHQKGYSHLEVIEFDPKTKQFIFHEIEFPADDGRSGPPHFSEANPRKCNQCHGEVLRPIWETYALWPKVLGSTDRELKGKEIESYHNWYDRVRQNPEQMSRYRHLIHTEVKEPFTLQRTNADYNLLTESIVYRNLERIIANLKTHFSKHPEHESYKFAVIGAVLCQRYADIQGIPIEDFLSNSQIWKDKALYYHRETEKSVIRSTNRRIDEIYPVTQDAKLLREKIPTPSDHSSAPPRDIVFKEDIRGTSRMRLLMEGILGISMIDWNHGVVRDEYTFGAFTGGPMSFLYGGQWLSLLSEEDKKLIRQDLAKHSHPPLPWIAELLEIKEGEVRPTQALCESLQRVSLASIGPKVTGNFQATCRSPNTEFLITADAPPKAISEALPASLEKALKDKALGPAPLNACMKCHSTQNHYIPFDDSEQLTAWLDRRKSIKMKDGGHQELTMKELIHEMIRDESKYEVALMPLNRKKPVPQKDQDDIMNFLSSIGGQ